MKISAIALTAASASVALAQPHNHAHRHLHEHKQRDVTVTSYAPSATDYVYVLDGQEITPDEVCKGLEDNELKFIDGQDPGVCSTTTTSSSSSPSTTAAPTTTPTSTTTWEAPSTTSASPAAASSSGPAEFFQASSAPAWSSPSESASETASATGWGGAPPAASSSWGSGSPSGGTGLTAPFPDGELDCSTFPSDYGAVALDYLQMGGWSGLQAVTISGGAVTNIVTGIAGSTCTEGMMCSYACPPGYQKGQWPQTQGATGQSVGGISCSGGKLHLTNPGFANTLCVAGVGNVQATNDASGVVSICRTDYPGTESETVPVELQPGQTEPLCNPDGNTYYKWQGKSTSAQYYLNPIGTAASVGCQWGSPGGDTGNYAPINFGVGYSAGTTWLSIFQNAPTTTTKYQGTVEIQGNLSGSCKYSNGQYCGVTGCNDQGCTVSLISGTATYVISS